MHDLDNHFGAYNHLYHLPRADEALHSLRKAASCVKPLMRKRGWRVGILSEFLPQQPNLLGLNTNRGEHIQLRLRHPGDTNQFLPFEQVLDTLLHELCHNVWGPHDHNFHNLWNELRDEWEVLQLKGFSGEGFLGNGQVLGGSRIPVEEVRRRARAAAQERAKLYKKTNEPGHRLGGGASAQPQSRRRLRDILANAAQSRSKAGTAKVDSGCATGTAVGNKAAEDALSNGFKTQAEMDDANSIAIAQALQELYEQEEDNRIYDGLAPPPAPEGLTWDPETGLQAMNSAPTSRSTTPHPPVRNMTPPVQQQYPPRLASRAGHAPAGPSGSWQNGDGYDFNSSGRPVSRLVREAEAKQGRTHKDYAPQSPTPAFQNWPTSDTGASLFGSRARPISVDSEDGAGPGANWECPQCTFHNHDIMDKCEICDAPRVGSQPTPVAAPAPVGRRAVSAGGRGGRANLHKPLPPDPPANGASEPLGWLCTVCGTYMESQWWTCSQCGTMKVSS